MKNTLEGINSRLDEAEDQISNLEDKIAKKTSIENSKNKKKFNEASLRDLWDSIKSNNTSIIRVARRRRENKGLRTCLKK